MTQADADSAEPQAPTPPTGTPEHLAQRLEWLGLTGCLCPHAWRRSIGSLYGISFGAGWVRLNDAPDCPHHGGANRLARPKK
jgi:hypothetical protein